MKVQSFLLSALLVVGSTVVKAEDVQVSQVSFKDSMINQATSFVESTVNLIATPFLSDKDVECLARNIFYEAGAESEEGKVAVGLVTLNRVSTGKFADSVCGVVKQKTVLTSTKTEKEVVEVKTGVFNSTKQVVVEKTKSFSRAVCQFSWVCSKTAKIKDDDARWIESKRIAEELANGGYEQYRGKYQNALYFHAVYVNPQWKLKRVARTGNHIFYEPHQPK